MTEENRRQRPFGVSELLILAYLWREREIDTNSAAALMQRSDADARATLEGLVEAGLLERRGDRKGRTYLLSASAYRLLGKPAAYVRARGFEPEQMGQMILQYARAHGQITRKEVMELCRVNAPQACRLLKRLVEAGKLALKGHGVGRGAAYSIAHKAK